MGYHGKLFRPLEKDDSDTVTRRINPNIVIGERLRSHREDLDMTQWDVTLAINEILIQAGALGLPICGACTWSRIERGERSLTLLEGLAVSRILGIDAKILAPWNQSMITDWPKQFDLGR